MANASIKAAFERMWQHVVGELETKADQTSLDEVSTLVGDTSVSEQISTTINKLWVDPETDEYFGEGESSGDNKVSYVTDNLDGYFDFVDVEDGYFGAVENKATNGTLQGEIVATKKYDASVNNNGVKSGVLHSGSTYYMGAGDNSTNLRIFEPDSNVFYKAYPYTVEVYGAIHGQKQLDGTWNDVAYGLGDANIMTTRCVYTDSNDGYSIIGAGGTTVGYTDESTIASGGAVAQGNNTFALDSAIDVTTYHHYVVVVDSALVRVYLDGVKIGEGTAKNNAGGSGGYLIPILCGELKMCRVYNAILTDEQVANNYQDAIVNYYDIKKHDITYKPIKEMDNFPVTLASATYMNDSNTTVEAEIKALKKSGTYVIKGLTEMESHLPPFTEDEYVIAYNNGLLIHNAIQENCDTYKSFIIPKGTYPVCYQYDDGTGRTANGGYYIFNLADGVKLDMQGSELWVMYDSDNRSPYDKRSDATIYKFGGWVVGLSDVRDVEICNGKITGERELRSFTNSAENQVENTTGIDLVRCCVNVHIHDMDINSFMGDSISANSLYGDKGGYYESAAITMETLTTSGAIGSASPIWGHTDMTAIPAQCIGVPTYIWTGIGYNYVMSNHLGMFVYLYDDEETFITSIAVDQSEPFFIKELWGATKYRLYIGIGTALTSIAYRMTTECSNKVLIEDCKFTNNQRGGISNMPISTVIQRCMFDNCGAASYGGKPSFFDSTRYCIDIEDIASQDLTVRDCKFSNGFHGILSGAINAVYDNNTFINLYSSVLIYRGKNVRIINNRFYNCGFPSPASGTPDVNWKQTKVLIANNSGLIHNVATFVDGWSYGNNSVTATKLCNKSKIEVDVGHSVLASIENVYLSGKYAGIIDSFNSPYVCDIDESGGIDSVRGLRIGLQGANLRWYTADYLKNIDWNVTGATTVIDGVNAGLTKRDIVIENCNITTDGAMNYLAYFGDVINTLTVNNCEFNLCSALYKSTRINGAYTPTIVFNNCTFNWTGLTEAVYLFGEIIRYGNDTSAGSLTFNNCKFTNDSTEFTVTIKHSGTDKTYTFNNCIADDTVVLE